LPTDQGDHDFGWMLHDIDFANGMTMAVFYRAVMKDGIIDVRRCLEESGTRA
jgi:CRISPR-associated protein Cas5d